MQGGKKGLIINSKGLCRNRKQNRARANLGGQNARVNKVKPVVWATSCKKRKGNKKKGKGAKQGKGAKRPGARG